MTRGPEGGAYGDEADELAARRRRLERLAGERVDRPVGYLIWITNLGPTRHAVRINEVRAN